MPPRHNCSGEFLPTAAPRFYYCDASLTSPGATHPLRHHPLLRLALVALALACALLSSGCVSSILADRMLRAPNRQPMPQTLEGLAQMQQAMNRDFFSLKTSIRVAPDSAEIAIAVIEPGDYKLKHDLKVVPIDSERGQMTFEFKVYQRVANVAPSSPKGTVFVLHGIMMAKESMLHWGFFLAQQGYRAVLVDLRGHGSSTGNVITYGARERSDLTQVLDELLRRQLVAGRVGVLGLSYGGAVALQWAAHDPRIDAVVALAPFSDTREAIDEFARAVMPKLSAMVSPKAMSSAFVTAARRGRFTWDEIDVLAATRRLRDPVLLFHGTNDRWVPVRHSQTIKNAAPAGSYLHTSPDDHLSISFRLHPISEQVSQWFAQALAADCAVGSGTQNAKQAPLTTTN